MLQQLSILHQEDENERVQSLAFIVQCWILQISMKICQAKDDIEAMTLFKMAKVGIFDWSFLKMNPIIWTYRWSSHPAIWRNLMLLQAKADKDEVENEDLYSEKNVGEYWRWLDSSHGRTQKKSCFQAVVTMYHWYHPTFFMFVFLWCFNMFQPKRAGVRWR